MSWHLMQRYLKNLLACVRRNRLSARCVTLLVGCFICLFFSTCHSARRQTAHSPAAQPVLSASPNPVPAGDIDRPLGTTTIIWDTGSDTIGDLYVKVDREPEVFMARAPSGKQEVRWIQFDSFYEFRLYTKKHSKLLAKLEVTRDD
jgi:hypothetical protein